MTAGPFFFAFVDPGETTFGPEHERFDAEIFSLEIDQQEGEFATATIDIRNPKVGLLNAGRKRWAWITWDSGDTPGVVPLFFGRLVAVPQDLQAELLRLEFIARPDDYAALQAALGETLKAAPYWDPVFITPDRIGDPDALLEGRPARWHIDRVTHGVTISDILQGEDGTVALGGDYFYDSLSLGYGDPPLRSATVQASVGWNQDAAGTVDLTGKLLKAAKQAHSGDGDVIDTYTGDGLATAWPVKGTAIGAGWSVGRSFVKRGDGKWKPTEAKRTVFSNGLIADFPTWKFKPHFEVAYDASRSRVETLSLTLEADTQAVLTEPGDAETVLITTSSNQVDQEIDPEDDTDGGTMPIGDPRRRSYFQTDRGHRSIEYLIALARAKLLARARTATIGLTTRWENGLDLSCRKSVSIADDRLPGGAAIGKVVGYTLSADGDSGVMDCSVTLACAIGKGNSVSPAAGTPTYVATGYVGAGYQVVQGATLSTAAGDVTFAPPDGQDTPDDGVDFFAMAPGTVLASSIQIIDGKKEQAELLDAFLPDAQAAIDALGQAFTEISVSLRPLNGGPYQTDYIIAVSDLMVPRMVDLEAAAI